MKTLKKLACILLAVMMVLAMTVPAAADTTPSPIDPAATKGTITIKNAQAQNNTYKVYKIFDVDSLVPAVTETQADGTIVVKTPAKIVYTIDQYLPGTKTVNPWYTFVTENAAIKNYFTLDFVPETNVEPYKNDDNYDDSYYVYWALATSAGENAATLAAQANTFLKDDPGISPTKEYVNSHFADLTIDGLDLGYYLVTSTVGAHSALVTTQPGATIEAKNEGHTITKAVKDSVNETTFDITDTDGNLVENKKNITAVGQTVDFRITMKLGKGAQNIVVHDQMCEGLTLDSNSIKVFLGDLELVNGTNDTTYYTVRQNVAHAAENGKEASTCTFEIAIDQDYLNTVNSSTTNLVVTYSADVNTEIKVSPSGEPIANENLTWLSFGESSETPPDKTETFVLSFQISKFTNTDTEHSSVRTPLAGAVFGITKYGTDSYLRFIPAKDEQGQIISNTWMVPSVSDRIDSTNPDLKDRFTTGEDGLLIFLGLDAGFYELYEIEAPEGFTAITEPIVIEIKSDNAVTIGGTPRTADGPATYDVDLSHTMNAEGNVVPVLNQSGDVLPQTGGSGTTVFYIVGGIMVLAAVVFLVTKRRMNAKD